MLRVAWGEVQSTPLHGDLAAAHAEEAAEVDHGGLRLAILSHEDIDQSADVLALRIGHFVPEDRQGLLGRHMQHHTGVQYVAAAPSNGNAMTATNAARWSSGIRSPLSWSRSGRRTSRSSVSARVQLQVLLWGERGGYGRRAPTRKNRHPALRADLSHFVGEGCMPDVGIRQQICGRARIFSAHTGILAHMGPSRGMTRLAPGIIPAWHAAWAAC